VDNPSGFALEFYRDGDVVFAEVTIPAMYCGYDGVAHGGIVALLLDEAMGWAANCAAGGATATGELTVRYRRPTPVNETIRIEGRVLRARSPIYYVEGRLVHDGAVCATGTAKLLKQTQGTFGDDTYEAVYAPGAVRLTDLEPR
jgi:acyl-coenzyme A thioesterase PaaI-like protein